MRPDGQGIGGFVDGWKFGHAEHLHRCRLYEGRQVEFDELDESRQVGHHQQVLVLVAADKRQDGLVFGMQKRQGAPAERFETLAQRNQPSHPPQQGMAVAVLGFDVDDVEMELGIYDDRQIQLLGVGPRKAGIAIGTPLHRGADAVAVPQEYVVPHADFVTVIDHRGSRQRQQQTVHEFDPPTVVCQQGGQPAADPQVQPHLRVVRVDAVHVIPFFIGDHFKGQFVVVAKKDGPLTDVRNIRRLFQDVDDGEAVLHAQCHEKPRHQRKVKVHVALVPVSEVGRRIFGPLIGFAQKHAVSEPGVDVRPQFLQVGMGFRQVFTVGALAFIKIGYCVQAQTVDAYFQPEVEHPQNGLVHLRVVEIEVRLMGVKPVPVVGAGGRIP